MFSSVQALFRCAPSAHSIAARSLAAALAILCGFTAFSGVALAAPGDLITTWGTGGKTVVANTNATLAQLDTRQGIATSDGGMVLLGNTSGGFSFESITTKHTASGAVDASFGKRIYRFSAIGDDYLVGGAEISVGAHAGKLLIVGATNDGDNTRAFVARTMTDGVLDLSFGTNGYTVIPRFGNHGRMEALGVMSDSAGRPVVVGWADQGVTSPIAGWMARLSEAGVMDPTFGTGGTFSVRAPDGAGLATNTLLWRVVQQASGNYVAAGHAFLAATKNSDIGQVIRVTSAGVLDTSFGSGGFVQMDLANRVGCPASTPTNNCATRFFNIVHDSVNNRLALVGDASTTLAAAGTYNSTATAATTTVALTAWLTADGATTGMPSPQRFALNPADPGNTTNGGAARAVSVDASGNTFVGMQSFGTNSISRVGVAKFDAAGAFAAGFSGSTNPAVAGAPLPGLASVGLSSGDTRGVRVNSDGTIVIGGHGRANQNADGRPRRFHSARFLANGTLDSTYGGVPASGLAAGQLVNTIGTADSQGRIVLMYPDDSALLVSSTNDAVNTDARARQSKILLTKLLANGLPDPTFGTAGSLVVPRLNEAATPVVGSMVSFFPRAAARNSVAGGSAEGKIVIAGECQMLRNVSTGATDNDACVVRVNGTTGAIDTTFGPSGTGFVTGGIAGFNEIVFALRMHGATLGNGAVDPDAGKIVVAVQASGATTALTVSVVLRLTEAGLDDTTFVTTPAPDNVLAIPAGTAGIMSPRALRIDRDGKYVVSGFINSGTNNAFVPYVARISNGAMDATFGTSGVFSGVPAFYSGIGDAYAFNNAVYNNGRILYGGRVNLALENARSTRTYVGALTATGAIDYSFGVDGWVVLDDTVGTQSSEPFFSMFVEPGGRILVGSTRTADDVGKMSEMRVTRLNFDGSIDTSYGVVGTRSITFAAAPSQSKADIIRHLNTDGVGNLIGFGLTWDNVSDGRVPAAFKLVGEAITIDSSYRDFLSFRDAAYQQQHVYTATNRSTSTVALNLGLATGGSNKFTLDNTLCSSTQCAENGASANTLPAGITTPCGATLAPAAQCYFMVSFRPTAAQPGNFRENLIIGDLTAVLNGRTCYLDLDRDSNRTLAPAVEGLLMMRYMLGLRGAILIADIPWTIGTPPTAATVEARIGRQLGELDIDGDTLANGLTDGLMLMRMMFGYKGDQVTGGAINPLGSRNTWPAVQNHVRRVCGAAFSLK